MVVLASSSRTDHANFMPHIRGLFPSSQLQSMSRKVRSDRNINSSTLLFARKYIQKVDNGAEK